EPVDEHAVQIETLDTLAKGRLATTEALQQAKN
ncbi:hypothetical protein AAUPMC_04169, partial [Pasteurella multocida subsp. multocida str. Anand1_cattle]